MTSKPPAPTAPDITEQFIRLMRPARSVVPVLGAGVSKNAGLPDASALAKHLLQIGNFSNGDKPDTDLLPVVVDALAPSWRAESLTAAVAAFVSVEPPLDNPLARVLIHAPSRFIVTLNYDLLIEKTAAAFGLPRPRTLTYSKTDLEEAFKLLLQPAGSTDRLTVLHLHGAMTDPAGIVLSGNSYQDLARNRDVEDILRELAMRRTMLFCGTSLNETYLLAFLAEQRQMPEHVLLGTVDETAALVSGRVPVTFSQYGIRAIPIDSHDHLPMYIRQVNLIRDEPTTGGAQTTGALPDAGTYIPNEFSNAKTEIDERDQLSVLMNDETDAAPAIVTEDDVATSRRSVVVGGVGTGKTDLLSHLARRSRPDRPGVLIRLGDQSFSGGSPERVLSGWAKNGLSVLGNVNVAYEAIEGSEMHFLLDGLDEVPSDQQASAAELIGELAQRLPQHTFTVTSREIAATEALTDLDSWAFWRLKPGTTWQARYLEFRDVGLADLLEDMPELEDIREVLITPFFLSRIVDLHKDGRLAGLNDLGELLAALIDSQLDHEEDRLLMDKGQVRVWLQDVALSALLAGRTSLTAQELSLFPLPADAAGDPKTLADVLVQRLLLAEQSGVYRFAHRVLGEQLAAESLLARAPTGALLESLVPRRTSSIARVREEALFAVTIACLRSKEWRHAVSMRDPLAAACATPTDATETERSQAAALIWDTYTEFAVWMWQRGASVLLNHAVALGRLIGRDPDSEIAQRIRAAIHTGDREQQGNALTAWARSRPQGFVEDLRKVLADPERSGVVHRQAAVAAEDCGYTELLDELARLVETARDHTVQQTAASALVRLLPDDRRLEYGLRLMRTAEADMVLTRMASYVTAEELLVMAAAYEGKDPTWNRSLKRRVAEAVEALATDD